MLVLVGSAEEGRRDSNVVTNLPERVRGVVVG